AWMPATGVILGLGRVLQSSTKLMRMFTRHSVTLPELSVMTLMSLTQAHLLFFMVLAVCLMPLRNGSSIRFGEVAVVCVVFAIVMTALRMVMAPPGRRCRPDAS